MRDPLAKDSSEVAFVRRDQPVETLPADRPDEALAKRVGLRRSHGRKRTVLHRQLRPGCQAQPDHYDEVSQKLTCTAGQGRSTARHGTRIVAARNELRWNSCRALGPDLYLRRTRGYGSRTGPIPQPSHEYPLMTPVSSVQ